MKNEGAIGKRIRGDELVSESEQKKLAQKESNGFLRPSVITENVHRPLFGNPRDILSLVVWIGVVFLASVIGSLATSSGLQEWYGTLEKPSFQPPNWIFGPVWSCLYLMMAISAWIIWRKRNQPSNRSAANFFVAVFGIQLVLNVLWSVIFFGYQSPSWAFFEICILWCAIATTVFLAYRQSVWSGHLLVPYLGWASFALVLNLSIWQLN